MLAIPSMLSTAWGRQRILDQINRNLSGHLSVDSIKVSWLGVQEAKGLTLRSKEGVPIGMIQSVRYPSSILHFFLSPRSLPEISLEGISANTEEIDRLTPFFRQKKAVHTLFGSLVKGDIKIQGSLDNYRIQAKLAGENGKITLDGLIREKTLFLNDTLFAEVVVTPELVSNFLQPFFPFMSGLLATEQPVRVTIDSSRFAIPLSSTFISQAKIGKMTVDVGHANFSAKGQLNKLMEALNSDVNEPFTVWFTPIYLSMTQGIVKLERFDMLLMSKHSLATWGTVNIPNNEVEMEIGLSGKTLQEILGVKFSSEKGYVSIPLKGRLGKINIDKSKLMNKIASFAAQMSDDATIKALGTVFGFATGSHRSSDAIPPPTTQPLPWETFTP